jgi:NAD+ synthase
MSRRIEERIAHVVSWLREQVQGAGAKGLIVGLSGGIDSSVVAYLIKRAFPEDSLGVILPCKSNDRDAQDAEALADACGIEHMTIELTETHDTLWRAILKEMETIDHAQLTDANLRARLRMSTLYAVAGSRQYLVAGTDNAAEVYTGYFTKYGDGGVDLLPIANLTKREVYEWAAYLGVPASVIERPPSAGLWEGQTDEEEMGITYNTIDDYLDGKPIDERDRERLEAMHARTEHKRKMPPAPPAFND